MNKTTHKVRLNDQGQVMSWREREQELVREMLADIKAMRDNGLSYAQIGAKLGVTRGAVNNFEKGYVRKRV